MLLIMGPIFITVWEGIISTESPYEDELEPVSKGLRLIKMVVVLCCYLFVVGLLSCLRSSIREKHNIKGTACNDCGAAFCCSPCVLCQSAVQDEWLV